MAVHMARVYTGAYDIITHRYVVGYCDWGVIEAAWRVPGFGIVSQSDYTWPWASMVSATIHVR